MPLFYTCRHSSCNSVHMLLLHLPIRSQIPHYTSEGIPGGHEQKCNRERQESQHSSGQKGRYAACYNLVRNFCYLHGFMVTYMVTVAVDSENVWPKELYVISVAMGHANSMFNCFTYGFCNPNFRRGYYVFLLRLFRRKANVGYADNSSAVRKEMSTVATLEK